jgi:parallel beta-helix repeat protein
MGSDGVVYLGNATGCVVENCEFRGIGKNAVCIHGGHGNRVEGCEIAHSAGGGVLILDGAGSTVTDNHIHHCGEGYKHNGGVVIQGKSASGNTVAHNAIHDMARYGISLKNPGAANVIEYNRVLNTSLETHDTGAIEVTQHDREFRSGSIIRGNLVGDSIGYSTTDDKPCYMSWGIYLDSFAGGYEVTGNITYRNSHGGIMLQGGKDNRVTNNIFVDSRGMQGLIANFSDNSRGQILERNIFYWTTPDGVLYATGKGLTQDVIRIENNLIYQVGATAPRMGWGGWKSFADWQARGFDTHSVYADPLFVDPANDDYTLRPDSPAFKLGFVPIDASKIGPRQRRCACRIVPAGPQFWGADSTAADQK